MTSPTSLEQRLQSWSPAVAPPTFGAADVAYAVTDTAVGRILLARNDSGALIASRFVPDDAAEDALLERIGRLVSPRILRRPGDLDPVRRQLDEVLAGRRHTFELATDLALATPFQRTVLTTLGRTVGWGARASYGDLADRIGKPSAARAVGSALGANPLCIVLPCHRVVGAHGALTGYAGGTAAKRYLLDLEAAG
ncbi:MAG: methylated-DNA--[protein]-cysteine S-methyltransferase [Lapillicoccus sp.]